VKAVLQFCEERSSLLYLWMRYLPILPIEEFWEPLYSEIQALLSQSKILKSMNGEALRLPSELCILPDRFLHGDQPLFDDLEDDIYLSSSYKNAADIEKLKDLGLSNISWHEILDRLEADLQNSNSKMRATEIEDEWHTAVAELMAHIIDVSSPGGEASSDDTETMSNDDSEVFVQGSPDGPETLMDRLLGLEVIPLRNTCWASSNSISTEDRIYFPYLVDDPISLPIPGDIGLRVVHPEACVIPDRKELYERFGISDCEHQIVTNKILHLHTSILPQQASIETRDLRLHLEILFWFGRHLTSLERHSLYAMTDKGLKMPSDHLFFHSEEEYHGQKLLQHTNLKNVKGFGFLDDKYLESKANRHYRYEHTWKQWLEHVAGIRYFPRLHHRTDTSKLDHILEAVLRDNPSKFIGTIQAHWESSYRATCVKFPIIKNTLEKTKVLCQNGKKEELQNTFLPTAELTLTSRGFGVESQMAFLELSSSADTSDDKEWSFLNEFGVCCEVNLKFYFEVLSALQVLSDIQGRKITIITDVYKSIGRISNFECKGRLQVCSILGMSGLLLTVSQGFFGTRKAIYVPGSSESWNDPTDCVWDGPDFLLGKKLLRPHYDGHDEVKTLFVNYLHIDDATYWHVLEELISLRKQRLSDNDKCNNSPDRSQHTTSMYETLLKMVTTPKAWNDVR
jgi:hypothetical protein